MTREFLKASRHALSALAIAAAAASTLLAPTAAIAAAPAQQKTQAPGYYRMALGDFEVTALYDGYIDLNQGELLKNVSAPDLKKLLARMFLGPTVQTSVNGYLVNTGTNLVLVDVGAGKCFGPTLGTIQDSIRAAGYQPEQVDTVVITHLHGDHSCGLIGADGQLAFPNAELRTAKSESDFWLSEEVASKAPKQMQQFFKMARDSVQPYIAAGKFHPFQGRTELAPGLIAVPTPGHTPGHTSYQFSSKGETLLVLGDLIHSHAAQFPRPKIAIQFDIDSPKAVKTREAIFAQAAKNKTWLAGAHLPFPGIGRIRTEGSGYAWVPVEYAPIVGGK
ncbi:MBL fold metallo-hydrolase [Paraherbaspirillum soli]|uniref:MBL fold metallo-hydrolase n=1 Tax=Paraherbaspirillum soli TaxID=631222 RepID=A0ABW0MDV7_9BURK